MLKSGVSQAKVKAGIEAAPKRRARDDALGISVDVQGAEVTLSDE